MFEKYILVFGAIAYATNAATITRRAVLPRATESTSLASDLIGYSSASNTVETWECRSSSAWQTIGGVGKCCKIDGSDCFMATTCVDGSVMVNGQASSTCTGTAAQTSCVTGTVLRSIGDTDPIMNYQCWPQWNKGDWTATRVTTSASSTPATSTSTPSSSASSSPTSALPAETSPAGEPKKKGEKSKAWIAGPVIGGILGAIFFTHFGIWLYRRRLRAQQNPSGALEKDAVPLGAAAGSPGATGESVRYAHMHGEEAGVIKEGSTRVRVAGEGQELPNQQVHELGGSGLTTELAEADGRPVRK